MNPRIERAIYGLALVFAVAPLFAGRTLPLVDLPQHLHLISALHRLGDPTTLFPEYLARRPELTPYLGYYYVVSLLNWLLPLELANRLFLAAYVAGLPLSLAFLLRSLKRPAWPSLLAVPFAYGDSFAWGFVNYCSAIPLAFLTCGFFIRAIEDTVRRRTWAISLGFSLVAVLLFHVQVFAYLAFALPLLLFLSKPETSQGFIKDRTAALLGVVPGVALFLGWVGLRIGQPAEIAPGQPWHSWGPLLSEQNLSFKPFAQNRDEFLQLLGNMLRDGSDLFAVKAALGMAAAGLVLSILTGRDNKESAIGRWRIVGLAAIAFALFFTLPFDIRGYMYYLNTRYAHLAAAVLVVCVPPLREPFRRPALFVAATVSIFTALPLWSGFKAFDAEADSLVQLAQYAGPKPKVMGLVFNTGSAVVRHPVYLHSSAVIARERGGITNFSFALTPHSPLMYRGAPPPTFASEWNPGSMDWATQGSYYDHFVVRGAHPRQVLGGLVDSELVIAGQVGDFFLLRSTRAR